MRVNVDFVYSSGVFKLFAFSLCLFLLFLFNKMSFIAGCRVIHDLLESQCSPRKLRFGVPSPPTYLVKPDCSAHRFTWTLNFSKTLSSDKPQIVSTSCYTKNKCIGECLDQLHSLHLVCAKCNVVQIAKI